MLHVGFSIHTIESYPLFVLLLTIPAFPMIIYDVFMQQDTVRSLQPLGIIYEIIGFMLMIISTSASFIFKIKMKIPEKNYGIMHPTLFKHGAVLIIAGLMLQLSISWGNL